jgi:dienelactone hydrolase
MIRKHRPAALVPTALIFMIPIFLAGCGNSEFENPSDPGLDSEFPLGREDLILEFSHSEGERRLSFADFQGEPEEWRRRTRAKLAELLGFEQPAPCEVREIRSILHRGVTIHALVLQVSGNLSIPGYLLEPPPSAPKRSAVMAIHGHGSVEPCIGVEDDYHHMFALEMARDGHLVLCPELRGFSSINDLAAHIPVNRLNYWIGGYSQFTLVTDSFLFGKTLIGETVEDLLRWEDWLARSHGIQELDAAGISYGGDLCLVYPALSRRIRRIFASGTMGSFSPIFQRCYNAPAHCIPGILVWMDRSDIAGLSAPRPFAVHYGERDVPGPDNASAAYNETVPPAMQELRAVYRALGAPEGAVRLIVTPGKHHEMDIPRVLDFLR